MIGEASRSPTVPVSAAGPEAAYRGATAWLTRPIAGKSWDAVLYCCGFAAAASLVVSVVFPRLSELVAFTALIFYTNGPTSTFLPSASEPVIMALGKLYPSLLLAVVAVPGVALAELVNYRMFRAVLHIPQLKSVREARMMRWATRCFAVHPFLTVVACAMTPIPFWMARACAVVVGYPFGRFTVATVLGRFPRIWLIAFLGSTVPFTSPQIVAVGVGVVLVLATAAAWKSRRRGAMGGAS